MSTAVPHPRVVRVGVPACALVLTVILAGAGRSSVPRNVLLLVTDDQAWDTIGRFNPRVATPHLDRLVDVGTWFSQAVVSTSVCPASRMSMLTGLYFPAHRFTFDRPKPDYSVLSMGYPALLRQAGYYSGFVGKNGMLLNSDRAAVLFDEWEFYTREYFDASGSHLTDRIAERARQFLQQRTSGQPWSLVVWFHAPHADDGRDDEEPFPPPTRYEHLYDGVEFPVRAGSDAWPARPELFEKTLNRFEGKRWWRSADYQHNMRRYQAMIRGVDDAVGKLQDVLAATGQADETLIVFLSDNGFFRGERGFGGKWLGHDASIRVPLIIVDPDRPGGATVDALVSNVDVAPTVLESLGQQVPAWMQGRSLAPFVGGGSVPGWRGEVLVEHSWTPAGRRSIPRTRGIRTPRFKYLEYPGTQYREMYDLAADPDEMTNLAGQPEWAEQEIQLRQRTRRLQSEFAAELFADGFESHDASRWPLRKGIGARGAVSRRGQPPHPWALTGHLGHARKVYVGLTLPRRSAVTASFRLDARRARTVQPVPIATFAGAGPDVTLQLAANAKGARVVLAGSGSSVSAELPDGWASLQVAWSRDESTYSLWEEGRLQGSVKTQQTGVRRLRFGLPAGAASGRGSVVLDEFVIRSSQ